MIYGYIAATIDGCIADLQGNIDFLNDFQNIDCGYDQFIQKIDVIVMGRKTYESIMDLALIGHTHIRKLG